MLGLLYGEKKDPASRTILGIILSSVRASNKSSSGSVFQMLVFIILGILLKYNLL